MDVTQLATMAMGMQRAQDQMTLQMEIMKQSLGTNAQVLEIVQNAQVQAMPPEGVGQLLDISV